MINNITVMISRSTRSGSVLLVGFITLVLLFLHTGTIVGNLSPEQSYSKSGVSIPEIETRIAAVDDTMLRDALFDLLSNAVKYSPQLRDGDLDGVMAICRSSQRVYCNFMGFRPTHMDGSVRAVTQTIRAIYNVALDRVSWITERKNQKGEDSFAKAYASIKDKYDRMSPLLVYRGLVDR